MGLLGVLITLKKPLLLVFHKSFKENKLRKQQESSICKKNYPYFLTKSHPFYPCFMTRFCPLYPLPVPLLEYYSIIMPFFFPNQKKIQL